MERIGGVTPEWTWGNPVVRTLTVEEAREALRVAIAWCHSQLPNGTAPRTTGQADTKADTRENTMPDSVNVLDLCRLLKKELPKGRTRIEIARQFTNGDETKAQNLLRQTRRYRHLWE